MRARSSTFAEIKFSAQRCIRAWAGYSGLPCRRWARTVFLMVTAMLYIIMSGHRIATNLSEGSVKMLVYMAACHFAASSLEIWADLHGERLRGSWLADDEKRKPVQNADHAHEDAEEMQAAIMRECKMGQDARSAGMSLNEGCSKTQFTHVCFVVLTSLDSFGLACTLQRP
eukprot:3860440-Pleurochrysis_carterae.AAC.3